MTRRDDGVLTALASPWRGRSEAPTRELGTAARRWRESARDRARLEDVTEGEVDQRRVLFAEADVDSREDRIRDREADAGTIVVLDRVDEMRGARRSQSEVVLQFARRHEHPPDAAEHRSPDMHVPEMEEIEAEDREPVLRVEERSLVSEEAMREEAAERVVAAELLELPERDVPPRPLDQAAIHANAEQVVAARNEREQIADVAVDAR